jgi:hypothetical protein
LKRKFTSTNSAISNRILKHFLAPYFLLVALLGTPVLAAYGQNAETAAVFQTVLNYYYKNEKPVYKGRAQLLYLFCTQAKPNEELLEALKTANLPQDFRKEIKQKIAVSGPTKDWTYEFKQLPDKDPSLLKKKINSCVSLEKFQEIRNRLQLNNQQLLIITEPLFYTKQNTVLVKVVFYRSIEHNSGAILLLEKTEGNWYITQLLNEWST